MAQLYVKAKNSLIKFTESVRAAQESHSFSVTKNQSVNVVQNNNDCSGNHAKHMNELCVQNARILNVKLVVYIISIRLQTG